MRNSAKLITAGLSLLMFFGYSKSLSHTHCFPLRDGGSTCFIQPEPLVVLPWSSAMEWCKNVGGTLPIPENQVTLFENARGYFGFNTETLWLGAKITYDIDNWYWTNGSRFTGTLENSNVPGTVLAYIIRNGTYMKLVAGSFPCHTLCEYANVSEMLCANDYEDSYWTGGMCYVKQQYMRSSWNDYRSNCLPGSPAIVDNLNDVSRWLEDLTPFCIGLHCAWWNWHNAVTGDSYELSENRFGAGNNMTTAKCLVSYSDSYGNLYWNNMDCNSNLPFICQYNVTNPTNSPTTASGDETVSSSTQTATTSSLRNSNNESKPTIFGLSMEFCFGLGGGVTLAATVWLTLITVYACKQPRGAKIFPE